MYKINSKQSHHNAKMIRLGILQIHQTQYNKNIDLKAITRNDDPGR